MQLFYTNYYYDVVEKGKSKYGSSSTIGIKLIFEDTTSWFDSDFYIATSFVFNDSLFHLCVDSNITYLAKIDSGKIKQLQTIGNNINIYRHHYSYRGNSFKNNSQLLKFRSKKNNLNGFIEIFDNTFKIRYINNIDTAKYLSSENADAAFIYLFDFIVNENGNLFLKQIDSIEPSLGGTDVTLHHKISMGTDYYPNKENFKLETPRVYKKIEDSTLTLLSNYYYTKQDGSIKVFFYEWKETWENDYDIYASENETYKTLQFQNRYEKIEKCITNKIGDPSIRKRESHGYKLIWKTENDLIINLSNCDFNKYRHIIMIIYKE